MLQHIGTVTIETLRLILRKFEDRDAEEMYRNWASDPEVCRFLSWGPHTDISTTQSRIRHIINSYSYAGTYHWAIFLKSRNEVIGSISVEISNDKKLSCEIGYCIGKEFWGRSIMTEAVRAVMHYLFQEVGYETIQAKHDVLNVASGRVMQKAGMRFEKILYHVSRRRDGSLCDCALYSKKITDG